MRVRAACGLATVLALVCLVPALADTVVVPVGGTIQDAIIAANPGDTVVVPAGTYAESVVVDKEGIVLDGSDGAVVVGTGETIGVLVVADGVTVRGFGITGDGLGAGVVLDEADGCTVDGNTISGKAVGIDVLVSQNAVVSGNEVTGNGRIGVLSRFSDGTKVTGNTVSGNGAFQDLGPENAGIYIEADGGTGSPGVVVSGNVVDGNYGAGIILGGLLEAQTNLNVLSNNMYGVFMWGATNCGVAGNLVSGSSLDGILHYSFTTGCTVVANLVLCNGVDAAELDPRAAGIRVMWDDIWPEPDSTGNTIKWNCGLGNSMWDASDETGPRVRLLLNTWVDNLFGTTSPKRID